MSKSFSFWTRRLHRWGGFCFAVPMLVVILSGLLLQLKKQVTWVQPPTQSSNSIGEGPTLTFAEILNVVRDVREADVSEWSDVDRIDVRPTKGIAKVRCENRWEVQVDLSCGAVLASTYRRSDFIESLHDGSYFAPWAKLWVFFPNGVVLLGLLVSGIWLWYLPLRSRRRRANKKLRAQSDSSV
ncbi:PepSY domain-containing protein [Neorhodopirellula lusitana]|uniref:PepSY domain-containing protein n=1 Tax=Neorhodopirellula lusitana TaxID=445327 RepID=UPI00384B4F06